ncbi:MAG: hypothetical protein GX567_14875, partial [Clostridia bacterium]|nr:hypothetical protein [Clostridia bacterium]
MDKILYAVAYWGVAIFLIAYIIRARKLETEIGLTIKKILFSGLFVVLIYSITFTSDHLLFFYIGESIGFIAKDYMLYLMLCYTRLFSGVHIKEKKKNLLIIILFSIDAIILLINPFTNIAFSSRQVVVDSLTYYVIEPHLLYYYHIWAAYAVGILILLILLEKIVTTPREYRKKYAMVMLGFLFVMILNFIYIRTGLFMDISIIGLAVAVCLLFYFAVDYQPNIIISKMHKIIIDGTENPMLFFDYETNLVTVNRSARDVFDLPEDYHNNLLNFMEEFDLIGDVALEDNCKFI